MLEPSRKDPQNDEGAQKKQPPLPGVGETYADSMRSVLEMSSWSKIDAQMRGLVNESNALLEGRSASAAAAADRAAMLAEYRKYERERSRLEDLVLSSIEHESRKEQALGPEAESLLERIARLDSVREVLDSKITAISPAIDAFLGAQERDEHLDGAAAAALLFARSLVSTELQILFRESQLKGVAPEFLGKDEQDYEARIQSESELKLLYSRLASDLMCRLTSPGGQQPGGERPSQAIQLSELDPPKEFLEQLRGMREVIMRAAGTSQESQPAAVAQQQLQPQQLPHQPLSDDQLRAMILRNHPSLTGPEFAPADIDAWSRVCTLSVAECFSRVSAEQDSPSKQERLMALLDTRQQVKNLELQPALPEGAYWKPGMSRDELNWLKKSDLVPPNMIPILAMVLVGGLQIFGIFCKNPHQLLNGAIGVSPLLPLVARAFYARSVRAFSLLGDETRGLASNASQACDPVSEIELATRAASTVQALVDSGANSASGFFARWGRVNDLRNSIMRNLAEGIRHNLVEMNRGLYSTGTIPHRKQAALDSRNAWQEKQIKEDLNAEQKKQIKEDLDQLQTELSRYSRLLAKIMGWAVVVSSIPAAAAIYSMLRGVPLLNLVGGP